MDDKSLAKIPFNSSWKYALTICDYRIDGSSNCVFIKVSADSNFISTFSRVRNVQAHLSANTCCSPCLDLELVERNVHLSDGDPQGM